MIKLQKEDFAFNVDAADCREAIKKAGNLLIKQSKISPEYINEIFSAMNELGPYFVIAPGIALAHSRPSKSVYCSGFSMITLNHPVKFGHPTNDPVSIVCMVASKDGKDHIEALKNIAIFLSDDSNIKLLKNAKTEADAEMISKLINN